MDLDESPRKAEDELLEDENVDNSPPALDDDGDMGLFGSGSEEEEEDMCVAPGSCIFGHVYRY